MTSPTSCPDPALLKSFVDEALSEQDKARIIDHLQTCTRCLDTVEKRAVSLRVWARVAPYLGQDEPTPEPALQHVMDELKDRVASEKTDSSATHSSEPLLSFLSPPEKPEHLGRLGHYEVLEVIGRGGMGIVLRAFDEKLHRVVAIKVMAPQFATSATARKRFIREAQAAAAIRNDHVINIHAVEENNEPPYLVMEYIEGQSLQDWIDKTGPLELKEILRIGMQMAAGLAAAHTQGVIHRDIKPANILLENGVQRVKITDFGLARAVDDASLTQSGVVAGTPQYMSPEQARGEAVDHRTDLFSLGSVLYAMCTGWPPFRASGSMAVLRRVKEDTPQPIRESNPETPEWLVGIIDKLLAKDPANRFQSAAEVAKLLGQYLAHLHQPASIPQPRGLQPDAARSATVHPHQRRRWVAVALLAVAACLALTEATGVTQMMATLIVVFSPGGRIEPGANRPVVSGPTPPINSAGSTLDRLKHADIPPEKRAGLPPEVVAILEEYRDANAGYGTLAFDSEGCRLLYCHLGTICFWDVATGSRLFRIQPGSDENNVHAVAFADDGRSFLSNGGDPTTCLRDLKTGNELRHFGRRKERISGPMALSSDGNLVAVGCYSEDAMNRFSTSHIRVHDFKEGKQLQICRGHSAAVYGLAFLPKSKLLLSCSEDKTVRLWDAEAGTEKRQLDWVGLKQRMGCVAASPDGRYAAAGSEDGSVLVWDLTDQRHTQNLPGHAAGIRSLAFSPDGKWLGSAGVDGRFILWETPYWKKVADWHLPASKGLFGVAFTPDARHVATANYQGIVYILQLTSLIEPTVK